MKKCLLFLTLALTALLFAACGVLPAVAGFLAPSTQEVVEIETEQPVITPSAPPATDAVPTDSVAPTPPDVEPEATPGLYGPEDKLVAITFDDGPYQGVTDKILNVVEQYVEHDVHVTFFVLGLQVAKNPSLVARAVELGCEIGNHTYHHKKLTSLSPEEMLAEVEDVCGMVREIADITPALVRPPYGAKDDAVRANIPYPLILWDIDTLDWSTRNAQSTLEAALKCEDGDIILMHDVRAESAEAFEALVPQLLEKGFKLVTVSEMFAAKGIALEAGKDYRKAR